MESLPDTRLLTGMSFLIGLVFGGVAQRSHFCTLGAIADGVNFGDWSRLRMWLIAIAVAIIGTSGLQALGWFDGSKSLYAGSGLRWLSHLVGGMCFGVGMVLASGCGSKTLVRLGGGNLKSLVVFVFLAISAYMTLRGGFALARLRWLDSVVIDLGHPQDLIHWLMLTSGWSLQHAAALGMASGAGLLLAALASRSAWQIEVWLGGALTGLCVVAGWYVSGHLGYVAEHPDTLQEAFLATNSGQAESLSFVAPYAYLLEWLMLGSDTSKVITLGIAALLGVVAGSALAAKLGGKFRVEAFTNADDLLRHLLGAVLMGFGGVTALGCSIGQGLSGLSVLSLGALLTTVAIGLGAAAMLKFQYWQLSRCA
jgi:uncharacterized membrane protein YedE/YeeE